VEQQLAALSPGEVSEPVVVSDGYRIFRVVERSEANVVPFEQAREELVRKMSQQRYEREYEGYIEGLRKTAAVEIKVREVPLAVDPAAAPAGGSVLEDALDPPAPQSPPAPGAAREAAPVAPQPAAPEPEFETTPQAAPERVAPPPLPATPAPSPTPSPEPPVDRR
jgi:hypothetical protein